MLSKIFEFFRKNITKSRLLIAFLVTYILGVIGFIVLPCDGGSLGQRVPLALYRSLQLFVLNVDLSILDEACRLSKLLVWPAAFLAPAIASTAILSIFSRQFLHFIRDMRRPRSGHVVICGLGEVGLEIYRSFRKTRKVVLVEQNPDRPAIRECLDHGVSVLVGDVLEREMMAKARMVEAELICIVLSSDELNIEATLRISKYLKEVREESQKFPRILLHVGKASLIERLEHFLEFRGKQFIDLGFFNIYTLSARHFLRQYPPDFHAVVRGENRVHLVLFGFGAMGQKMAVEAAKLCHFLNSSRLKITVFDAKAQAKTDFLTNYPAFKKVCDFEFVPQVFAHDLFNAQHVDLVPADATQLIITFGNDTQSAGFALSLREHLLNRQNGNIPIFVRLKYLRGVAKLLTDSQHGLPDCIHPFGTFEKILDLNESLEHRDRLARSYHELSYLSRFQQAGQSGAAAEPWSKLPHFLRESNRLAVDHLHVKLRAVRHTVVEHQAVVQVKDFKQYAIPGLGDLETALAKTEKARWNAEKLLSGWKFGPLAVLAKQHDNILSWEEMENDSELKKKLDYDRDIVRHMVGIVDGGIALSASPEMSQETENNKPIADFKREVLEKYLGRLEVKPLHVVGILSINGKRHAKADGGWEGKTESTTAAELFQQIKLAQPGAKFVVCTALITPRERVAAELAMKNLKADLHVIMPIYYKMIMEKTDPARNDDPASSPPTSTLLQKAKRVFELPFRFGTLADMSAKPSGQDDCPVCRKQFELLPSFFASYCDDLILCREDENAFSLQEAASISMDDVQAWWNDPGTIPEQFRLDSTLHRPPRRLDGKASTRRALFFPQMPGA